MPNLDDENINQQIIKDLKALRKINSPQNFETDLMRKINSSSPRKGKKFWFDNIFTPQLIPSAALAITAAVIFFLLKPRIDEIPKHSPIVPRLYEEKDIEQPGLSTRTKKEKISISGTQTKEQKSTEINSAISNEIKTQPEIPFDATGVSPDEIPEALNKIEGETSKGAAEQKVQEFDKSNLIMPEVKDMKIRKAENFRTKTDSTKDSLKNLQKRNKF